MKKTLALTGCLALAFAGTAMATEIAPSGGVSAASLQIFGGINTADSASVTTSTMIGKLSKGVVLGAKYSNTGYALDTKHGSGNTAYGTSNDATAIFKSEIGLTTALTAPKSRIVAMSFCEPRS